jgi:hypothetical protein
MADSGAGFSQGETAIIGLATTVLAGFLGKWWDHLFGGRAAADKQRAEAKKLLEDAFDAKTKTLVDSYGKMIDELRDFYEKRIDELLDEVTHWRGETIALRQALDAARREAAGQ